MFIDLVNTYRQMWPFLFILYMTPHLSFFHIHLFFKTAEKTMNRGFTAYSFSIQYIMEDIGFVKAFFIMILPKCVSRHIFHLSQEWLCCITSELLQNCLTTWTEKIFETGSAWAWTERDNSLSPHQKWIFLPYCLYLMQVNGQFHTTATFTSVESTPCFNE
jgi:hypothetical protein